MLRFRGLHIVAGIAAMGVAAVLGMVMELSNTAIFTSSCVAYVAVSMWTESRIDRRRSQLRVTPAGVESAVQHPEKAAGELPAPEQPAGGQPAREQSAREQLSAEQHPRETRGGNAA